MKSFFELREATRSADKKPEKHIGPDGKQRIRMVPVDKEVVKETSVIEEKDHRIKSAGVAGYNKPKRTPDHPTKSHIVVAKDGNKVKTIRFGQQGVTTTGAPKKGESDRQKARRKSFKARHAKNIAKGKMSAAYWADKVKW